MQPVDLQTIGDELAIKWSDGSESFVRFEKLRRHCPCAGCRGEQDIFGAVYKAPEKPYGHGAFQLRKLEYVGSYAVQPVWADGHATGIYAWDYLRSVADAA